MSELTEKIEKTPFDTYNEEIDVIVSSNLSAKEKAKKAQEAKNKYEKSDPEAKAKKKKADLKHVRAAVQKTLEEEAKIAIEEAGNLAEIFQNHLVLDDITVNIPTHQFWLSMEHKYGNINAGINAAGLNTEDLAYLCYCLLHCRDKGFHLRDIEDVQTEAWEWFMQFNAEEHFRIRAAAFKAISTQSRPQKKTVINLSTIPIMQR